MALKKKLTEEERYGLTTEEIKQASKWLRTYKTSGALKDLEASKLFELFLLGDPLVKIAQQFPQYPLGQIALTAALRGWVRDRDKMMHTLQDRVRAKVVRSVLEQVDFLTSMMSVANAEHMQEMMKYIHDPVNNPKPQMRIGSIKEYKDVSETLYKIVAGATAGATGGKSQGKSPMFDALVAPQMRIKKDEEEEQEEQIDDLDIIAAAAAIPKEDGEE